MSGGQVENLDELLDRILQVSREHDPVSVEEVMDAVGGRSFGALLLLGGLVVLAPVIGDIPTVPTVMAVFVFLISAQMLFNRRSFWLPGWLRRRSLEAQKLQKAVEKSRGLARFVDRLIKPRLTRFITGPASYVVAVACLIIALLMPPMELIPFSANIAGAALSLFGLAYIGRDGLLALLAFGLTAAGLAVLVYGFL